MMTWLEEVYLAKAFHQSCTYLTFPELNGSSLLPCGDMREAIVVLAQGMTSLSLLYVTYLLKCLI
jgi:hypothetical protein